VAVLVGACGWVLLANKTGMPVSTTHAIIGALCGAGLVAFGGARFQWSMLGQKFAVPLAVSPVLSLAVVYAISWPVLLLVRRTALRPRDAATAGGDVGYDVGCEFTFDGGVRSGEVVRGSPLPH